MTQLSTQPELRTSASPTEISTPVDVYQNETGFLIRAELPNIVREDVSMEFENKELRLRAKRPGRAFGDQATSDRIYRRSFRIPEDIDVDRIEASLEDGLLTVVLPKAEAAKPKKIAVR